MARQSADSSSPQGRAEQISTLFAEFAEDILPASAASIGQRMAQQLAAIDPCPLTKGKAENWAAGMIYALAQANQLFQSEALLRLNASDLCEVMAVSKATVSSKAREVRQLLKMDEEPKAWQLPELESMMQAANSLLERSGVGESFPETLLEVLEEQGFDSEDLKELDEDPLFASDVDGVSLEDIVHDAALDLEEAQESETFDAALDPNYLHALEVEPQQVLGIILKALSACGDEEGDEATEEGVAEGCNGYLTLLFTAMQMLRYLTDKGHDEAKELVEWFREEVSHRIAQGRLHSQSAIAVFQILEDSGHGVNEQMLESFQEQTVAEDNFSEGDLSGMVGQLADDLNSQLNDGIDDPYAVMDLLNQSAVAIPKEARPLLIDALIDASEAPLCNALLLLVLDSDSSVRYTILNGLTRRMKLISPISLRRLIMIRNWLPKSERNLLDKLIKTVRKQGTACAPLDQTSDPITHLSSPMDGEGAMAFTFLRQQTPQEAYLAGFYVKQDSGIGDSLYFETDSRQTIEQRFGEIGERLGSVKTDSSFTRMVAGHFLDLSLKGDNPPPYGLLEILEKLQLDAWQPAPIDLQNEIYCLCHVEGDEEASLAREAEAVRQSGEWLEQVPQSEHWYLDDAEVIDTISSSRLQNTDKQAAMVLERFFEPQRLMWAERFAWNALWFQHHKNQTERKQQLAFKLASIARALYGDQPMVEIPAMRNLASLTWEMACEYA
uniref:DUF6398 domain-containing protein n=1 Tax=Magnetococcus massalia (strain MO-1) TaxID=451514 RepID=A0A1S7LGV3_MAGMO|nr:protein of unknown function [Candidatus Magnetococcus massalia]